MPLPSRRTRWLTFVLLLLASNSLSADPKVVLPSNPQQWLNSPPLSNEMLAGKAVVLWFFEETCPNCEKRWPDLLSTANTFEGQPIFFIAVNSGTPRAEIETYARRNQVRWPILLDPDRSIEQAADVGELSLQNVCQCVIIQGDGYVKRGDWSDIGKSAQDAVKTGKWKVDPSAVPTVLKPAWQQVEFGNYFGAAPLIRKNLSSPKPEIKTAAETLQTVVVDEMQSLLKGAETAMSAGQKWTAFKTFQSVSQRYKGYDIPAEVTTQLKELAMDTDVKNEQAASKAWETLKKNASNNPKTARKQLEQFLKQHSNSEAALAARAALDGLPNK